MKPSGGRVLAFDWGLRNVGVAVGTITLGTSQPLTVLKSRDGRPDWEAIGKLIAEWQPERVVVGEPLNMDGSDSDITPRARKFARQIEGRFAVPVVLVDERLSSREAKTAAQAKGHRGDYGERPVDAEAADIILQTWLNSRL